jgi:hypothetical protein
VEGAVKIWIRELYEKKHPGKGFPPEPALPPLPPLSPEEEDERRRFEEQMYWEDYADRNDLWQPKSKRSAKQAPAQPVKPVSPPPEISLDEFFLDVESGDEDVPF